MIQIKVHSIFVNNQPIALQKEKKNSWEWWENECEYDITTIFLKSQLSE